MACNLTARFSEIGKLKFLELLHPRNFADFKNNFPEDCFTSLKVNYGTRFDFPRLRSELNVIYDDTEQLQFSVSTTADLHKHLTISELEEVFPEVFKLSILILTIPVTSASAELSLSTLKRVKTYFRNNQRQERLSALSLLSIEKELLINIREQEDFYNKVIEEFAKKNRRIELKYK